MKKIANLILEFADSVVLALVAVMVVFTLFFRVYAVSGSSMESTLMDGDRLLVSQLFYTPKQGDIVCFMAKELDERVLVKRVIATAGQTVDIVDDRVVVDGEVLEEDYLKAGIYTSPKEFVDFPYTVKEGEVFCLGDNRGNSRDSRDIGPIETKYLLGRLIVRLFPHTGKVH